MYMQHSYTVQKIPKMAVPLEDSWWIGTPCAFTLDV